MIEQENYDVFILDEADHCILEKGCSIDLTTLKIRGFWEIMEKRTILLTATVPFDLNDVLKDLFGVQKQKYVTFDYLI